MFRRRNVLVLLLFTALAACSGSSEPTPRVSRPAQLIFVTDSTQSITAYRESDDGDVTPQVYIHGTSMMQALQDVALDASGRLYATGQLSQDNSAAVWVFSPGADGIATPIAVISCPAQNSLYSGIWVAADGTAFIADPTANAIVIFPPNADGCITSPRKIAGSSTRLAHPFGIAVDGSGEIVVLNFSRPSITVYAPGASGNVAPVRRIAGPDTRLVSPAFLALGPTGKIYVTDLGLPSINVYAADARGDASPIAQITGPHTALYSPAGIAVTASGEIVESDGNTSAVHVYPADANGDAGPLRTIAGPNTGILEPDGIGLFQPRSR